MTGGRRERKDLNSDADTQARPPPREGEGEVGAVPLCVPRNTEECQPTTRSWKAEMEQTPSQILEGTNSMSHQSQTSGFQNCLIINTCHVCHPVWHLGIAGLANEYTHQQCSPSFSWYAKHYSEFLLPSSKRYSTDIPSQPWWRLILVLNKVSNCLYKDCGSYQTMKAKLNLQGKGTHS